MTILADTTLATEPPVESAKFVPTAILLTDAPAPTEDQRLWSAANLEPLPTVVTFRKKRAREYLFDGDRFRDAGHITASPSGTTRFRIYLASDATARDLLWFEKQIALAKEGQLNGWEQLPPRDGALQLAWQYDRCVAQGEWRARPGTLLEQCAEPACTAFGSLRPFHDTMEYEPGSGWYHHTAECEFAGDGYSIRVRREVDRGVVADWRVEVCTLSDRDDTARLTSRQAAGFASDLQWAAAEVRRLNGEPLVAVTR